ncbi:MAG TPA: HAMP domain-containing sensor histidine kinase [Solirubrobacteraceae bacterium]|nr:HAMP domain-containing sensor histidine kinase [Solirubrobacteraceae bacterium]
MSLRRRIALTAAVAVAVAVVLGSLVAYAVVRDTLRGQIDASLRVPPGNITFRQRVPPGVTDPLEAPPVLVQRVEGDRIFATPGQQERLGDPAAVQQVADGTRPPYFDEATVDGVHVRFFTTRAPNGTALQLARPMTEVDDALSRLRLGLGLLALGGIALAAFLGRWATRHAVRPVTELTETAEHVARTRDLSRRIEAAGDDELARLAASFNTMLEALDESQRAQRRLVADASHELRTPLTSLRTNLEVLGTDRELPAHDRERLRRDLVAQLEELGELVGDLVELARDGESAGDPPEPLRFDELVGAAAERAQRHAPQVGFDVAVEPCVVTGERARLDRAVANLLDNAAKWSPPGGTVEVRLRDGELTVRYHGPGIAPEDLPHVFDRFYRATAARGRAGSGLGLAIVRQVAELHAGTVRAEPAVGGGALLRLALPVSHPIPT